MKDISVVLIAKNEEKTLPRLLESLKGINDIVLVDTGSTDNTVKIARDAGCNVEEVGDRFKIGPTQEQIDSWKKDYGMEPSFKLGEKYFHYANARNYAASLAKNDWVFSADCDEAIDWDLDKVREAIQDEDHLTYRFCYTHNPDGSCALEFQQCKMYRKSKLKWTKWIHEVLTEIEPCKPPKYCDFIYHNHWQNPESKRGHYLPGLELSVLDQPNDDRNVYYLGREYLWSKKYQEAIVFLEKASELSQWMPEKSQAHVFMGEAYEHLGDINKAIDCYLKAISVYGLRREPYWSLGQAYEKLKRPSEAKVWYQAALGVEYNPQGYLTEMTYYEWRIPDQLATLSSDKEECKKWWVESLKHNPDKRILNNVKYFYDTPLISIIVPVVRKEGFKRLTESIKENTVFPNYEIICRDEDGTAIKKFNDGVRESKGEFIVFLADDTEVMLGWLTQAFVHFKENLHGKGIVVLNDEGWKESIAHHFLISRNCLDDLENNEIFYRGYNHCGVDVELAAQMKKRGLYTYCKDAGLKHYHYCLSTRGVEPNKRDGWYKKVDAWREDDKKLLDERLEKI